MTIYKTCNKLIMLHPLSKEVDYNFHLIEEKSNKSLQQKAKKSKKQLQHVNPNNRTSDVANIHISCKSSQNRGHVVLAFLLSYCGRLDLKKFNYSDIFCRSI